MAPGASWRLPAPFLYFCVKQVNLSKEARGWLSDTTGKTLGETVTFEELRTTLSHGIKGPSTIPEVLESKFLSRLIRFLSVVSEPSDRNDISIALVGCPYVRLHSYAEQVENEAHVAIENALGRDDEDPSGLYFGGFASLDA
jgi:hypothetical protein